jgi:hypothetical protein
VVTFGGQMFHIQLQNMLWASMDAQLAAFTVPIADFDPTLDGHPVNSLFVKLRLIFSTLIIYISSVLG